MYKYFCDYCGKSFEHELPEFKEIEGEKISNSIPCPNCGSFCSFPDTKEGAERSVNELSEHEAHNQDFI